VKINPQNPSLAAIDYFTITAEFDKNISEPYSPGKLKPSNIL
jgi:hypothetical protein